MTARAFLPASVFTWSERDTNCAFAVTLWLDVGGHEQHSALCREITIGMQGRMRAPLISDAYAFFLAARMLAVTASAEWMTCVVGYALQLARRLGLAATGLDVVDIKLFECGASSAYGVHHSLTEEVAAGGRSPRFEITPAGMAAAVGDTWRCMECGWLVPADEACALCGSRPVRLIAASAERGE